MHKDKSREEYVDVSKQAMHEETQQLIFGPRYEERRNVDFGNVNLKRKKRSLLVNKKVIICL